MIFASIVIDFYWDRQGDYSSSNSNALFYASYGGSLYCYKINIHILVPDLDQFNLKVSINAIDLDKQIANWEYDKVEHESEVIKVSDTTNIVSDSESQPDLVSNGNGFSLDWSRVVDKINHGNNIFLSVTCIDRRQSNIVSDEFNLKVIYE